MVILSLFIFFFLPGYLCPVRLNPPYLAYDSEHSFATLGDQQVNNNNNNKDSNDNRTPLTINSNDDNRVQSLHSRLNLKRSIKVVQANCTIVSKGKECQVERFEALLNLADRSLCRCEPQSFAMQVNGCMQELAEEVELLRQQRIREKLEAEKELPTIFAITPTYARITQKVDLTSLCQTVMNVPNLVWIIIEDSEDTTPLVTKLLQRCKVQSVHLNVRTPQKMRPRAGQENKRLLFSRGVEQRNTGLDWIRRNCSERKCRGVVYFMDDDNKYDLRLFEEVSE